MSMNAEFREITPDALERLKESPELTESIVLADLSADPALSGFEAVIQAMPTQQRETMEAAFAMMTPEQKAHMESEVARAGEAIRAAASEVEARAGGKSIDPGELGERVSIDKAWHGLHYLLCGSPGPVDGDRGRAVFGGTEIGEDGGYGPARYLDAGEVKGVAAALAAVTEQELRDRFDPRAMDASQVYPASGWSAEEDLDWLLSAFEQLKDFYRSVARRGNAVLLSVI
jgi:hypothetical protein